MSWKTAKKQSSNSDSKTPDVNSKIPKKSSPNEASGKSRTNNSVSDSANKKVSSKKNKQSKKNTKKDSKKVLKYLEIEDVIQILWNRRKEFGFTQLVSYICTKSSKSVRNSKRETPFPVKRTPLLLAIRKIMREDIS